MDGPSLDHEASASADEIARKRSAIALASAGRKLPFHREGALLVLSFIGADISLYRLRIFFKSKWHPPWVVASDFEWQWPWNDKWMPKLSAAVPGAMIHYRWAEPLMGFFCERKISAGKLVEYNCWRLAAGDLTEHLATCNSGECNGRCVPNEDDGVELVLRFSGEATRFKDLLEESG